MYEGQFIPSSKRLGGSAVHQPCRHRHKRALQLFQCQGSTLIPGLIVQDLPALFPVNLHGLALGLQHGLPASSDAFPGVSKHRLIGRGFTILLGLGIAQAVEHATSLSSLGRCDAVPLARLGVGGQSRQDAGGQLLAVAAAGVQAGGSRVKLQATYCIVAKEHMRWASPDAGPWYLALVAACAEQRKRLLLRHKPLTGCCWDKKVHRLHPEGDQAAKLSVGDGSCASLASRAEPYQTSVPSCICDLQTRV